MNGYNKMCLNVQIYMTIWKSFGFTLHISFDSPPASVLSVSISLFIPSSGLPVSPPINLTAVTYILYIVYGLRLVRMYIPSKLVSLTT